MTVPGSSVLQVGPAGEPLGPIPTTLAHAPPGTLHRAVSVQIVDDGGRWLLQRRAAGKPLFAGRWANSSCTHPLVDESAEEAARRCVREELGLDLRRLVSAGSFTYRAMDPANGRVEHELDVVFLAHATGTSMPDPDHVSEVEWLTASDALARVTSPAGAPWAAQVLERARLVGTDAPSER